MQLKDWALGYAKMRAAAQGATADVHENTEGFTCVVEGKMTKYMVNPVLGFINFDGVFVTESTSENIDRLIAEWDKFANNPNITLIFVNVSNGDKWGLKPYHHAKIADKSTLKQGLLSMHGHCAGTAED
ncbi:MAG: hypothetical protein ABIA93_01160 [Candidatus Woesearchaeota archaeon]